MGLTNSEAVEYIYEVSGLEHMNMEALREYMIKQGEEDFEYEILYRFPYVIDCTVEALTENPNSPASQHYLLRLEKWCKTNLLKDSYKAFPDESIGIYRLCCRNVYFKNKSDALLFKLSNDLTCNGK